MYALCTLLHYFHCSAFKHFRLIKEVISVAHYKLSQLILTDLIIVYIGILPFSSFSSKFFTFTNASIYLHKFGVCYFIMFSDVWIKLILKIILLNTFFKRRRKTL